jgi:hypothetical protein
MCSREECDMGTEPEEVEEQRKKIYGTEKKRHKKKDYHLLDIDMSTVVLKIQ